MKDILFFDTMVTPKIITFVYWIILVAIILGGISYMFDDRGGFILGLIGIIFGCVFARIWCELMIVLFKMNEALQEIKNK